MTRRSNCPISCALDIVGDRWTLLILRDMMLFKKRMFYEFLESPEKIATNTLTDRLHKLEQAGLILKETYSGHRLRFAYKVSDAGEELRPLLKEFAQWGRRHFENTATPAMPE